MRMTNYVGDKSTVADEIELDLSIEELEAILAPTPSIPIPPPYR